MPNIVLTNRSYQTTIRRSALISLLRDAAACATIKRSNTALSPSEGLRLPAHQRKRQVTNHQSDAGCRSLTIVSGANFTRERRCR